MFQLCYIVATVLHEKAFYGIGLFFAFQCPFWTGALLSTRRPAPLGRPIRAII